MNVRRVSIFFKFPLGMLTIPGYLGCLRCAAFMFPSLRTIHFNYKHELQFPFDFVDISCPLRNLRHPQTPLTPATTRILFALCIAVIVLHKASVNEPTLYTNYVLSFDKSLLINHCADRYGEYCFVMTFRRE